MTTEKPKIPNSNSNSKNENVTNQKLKLCKKMTFYKSVSTVYEALSGWGSGKVFLDIIYRPGVAGAVLQISLS